MAIQRQYNLPNCKLILEGLGDALEVRPLVTAISNVECYFSGHEKPLAGGREFLESLVVTVSDYAQEFLSGVLHPVAHRPNHPKLVKLEHVEQNLHRLTVQPQALESTSSAAPQQFDLTTVQLFDLVEAIDQFYADAQTLPEMVLNLPPLSKRYVASQEPIGKRAAAPALGVSGLAIAAAALFFVPAPEVQRPQTTGSSTNQTESQVSPGATASASPPGSSPAVSPTAVSPTAAGEGATAASPTTSPTDPAASANEQAAAAILTTSPEITDPAEQERLLGILQEKIDQTWTTAPTFTEDLEYRVGVAANGNLVGYSFVNPEALQYKQEVPLVNLLQVPTATGATGASNPEPIAQFLVVFKPTGSLEISPWYGQAESSPSPTVSPQTGSP
jgi:hypothetical protein